MWYAYGALAGLQAVGGFQMADIIRQNGDLQTQINNMNAKYAELDAFRAKAAGYGTAARYQDVVDKTIGAERAKYAAENVSLGYGTAGVKDAQNHIAGLMNTMQIQRQAQDAAIGYQTQAINLRLGSAMTQLNASLKAGQAVTSGLEGAAGTLVAGYERSLSTGKGMSGRTGTNDKAWLLDSTEMTLSSNGPGFVPTASNSESGGWKPMSAPGNDYWSNSNALGDFSFTSESQ